MNETAPSESWSDHELNVMSAECSELREEIIKRVEIQHQIISLTLIVAGTLFTIGIQKNATPVLLIYPIFSVFLSAGWAHNELQIGYISAYFKDKTESLILPRGMGWENYYSNHLKNQGFRFGSLNMLSSRGIFLSTQVVSLLLAWPRLKNTSEEKAFIAIDLIAVLVTVLLLKDWRNKLS